MRSGPQPHLRPNANGCQAVSPRVDPATLSVCGQVPIGHPSDAAAALVESWSPSVAWLYVFALSCFGLYFRLRVGTLAAASTWAIAMFRDCSVADAGTCGRASHSRRQPNIDIVLAPPMKPPHRISLLPHKQGATAGLANVRTCWLCFSLFVLFAVKCQG